MDPELARVQEELRALREQSQSDQDFANSRILKVQDSTRQFNNVGTLIQDYIAAGGDDRLAQAKIAVAGLEKRISSIDDEIMSLSLAISEAESKINNMRQLERNVADNLRYREMQRDIARMKDQIIDMEKQNAEAEVEQYKERAEKLRKANNKWTAEVVRQLNI